LASSCFSGRLDKDSESDTLGLDPKRLGSFLITGDATLLLLLMLLLLLLTLRSGWGSRFFGCGRGGNLRSRSCLSGRSFERFSVDFESSFFDGDDFDNEGSEEVEECNDNDPCLELV